jgi:hypothetical protein
MYVNMFISTHIYEHTEKYELNVGRTCECTVNCWWNVGGLVSAQGTVGGMWAGLQVHNELLVKCGQDL